MLLMTTPAKRLSLATRTTASRNNRQLLHIRTLRNWSQSRDDARFQFKCTQCGKCCTGNGGRVRVNEREIEEITRVLQVTSTQEVEAKYLRRAADPIDVSGGEDSQQQQWWWFLRQTDDDAQCIFLDGTKCSIYKGTPTRCVQYTTHILAFCIDTTCILCVYSSPDAMQDVPVVAAESYLGLRLAAHGARLRGHHAPIVASTRVFTNSH